ncbi:MAG: cation:proton antiporter [Flavobacteriales bacterium]|nr:cation:proton antiporter [Flavobacteriales bacterium]
MNYYILILIAVLIILSYLFDAIARKTKFPSVIFLIASGIIARFIADFYNYEIPYLNEIVPALGTIGLILIVLEGALELEISKDKMGLILKGFAAALIILLLNVFAISYILENMLDIPKRMATINAIPLSIISSAVAIPSASSLLKLDKEFIVYESSFSDILGIILFNFVLPKFEAERSIVGEDYMFLFLQILIVIVASIIISFIIFELMEKISHKVKFFLILAILILVFTIGKIYHLSTLVIIFVFGLFLSNSRTLLPPFLRKFISMNKAEEGLHEFHLITAEFTFLIRTFFFLFFGFTITLASFQNVDDYIIGFSILICMFAIRLVYFLIFNRRGISSTLYISPRGLISILLFLQIPAKFKSDIVNQNVLLIVILGSILLMLFGTMKSKPSEIKKEQEIPQAESQGEISNEVATQE